MARRCREERIRLYLCSTLDHVLTPFLGRTINKALEEEIKTRMCNAVARIAYIQLRSLYGIHPGNNMHVEYLPDGTFDVDITLVEKD